VQMSTPLFFKAKDLITITTTTFSDTNFTRCVSWSYYFLNTLFEFDILYFFQKNKNLNYFKYKLRETWFTNRKNSPSSENIYPVFNFYSQICQNFRHQEYSC
jgi:hypothetical protein